MPSSCAVRSFDRVTSGHLDFGPVLTGSGLTPAIKDDRHQPARWKRPGGMIVELNDRARRRLPSGLGWLAPAGTPVYMIPGVQMAGVPWLGWNTQHPTILNSVDAPARMTLVSVRGPGKVAVFTSGSFGSAVGQRVFDTVGGPRAATVPINTHTHANWIFTSPGAYQLTIAFTVRTKDGKTRTGTSRINVAAGVTNPNAAFSGCAARTTSAGTGSDAPRGTSSQQTRRAASSQGGGQQASATRQKSSDGRTSGGQRNADSSTSSGSNGSTGSSDLGGSDAPVLGGDTSGGSGDSNTPASGSGGTDSKINHGTDDSTAAPLAQDDGQAVSNDALNGQALPPADASDPGKGGGTSDSAAPLQTGPAPEQAAGEAPASDEEAAASDNKLSTLAYGALGSLLIVAAGAGSYRWARRGTEPGAR